jgi:carbon-monoxide dehydrogenase large subunit
MPWTGLRLPRLQDDRFLRGTARFTDDLVDDRTLHAAIVRSPIAHGRLRGLDTSGVDGATATVLRAADLDIRGAIPVLWHLPGQHQHEYPVVDEHLRFVGQPVAIAVAATAAAATEAAAAIDVVADPLPVVVDPREARAAGAPRLYPDAGTNVMAAWANGDELDHLDAVFAAADHVRELALRVGRLAGAPMEGRGLIADVDGGRLVVHTSTQAPHAVRDAIARVTGTPLTDIRVVAPAVGGGFGVKDHIECDDMLVVLAALRLGRRVAWIEDRWESLVTTPHARDEHYDVRIAFDDDGTLRGLHVRCLRNAGAHFAIFGAGPMFAMAGMIPAPYKWDAVRVEAEAVATNTAPTGAYRGFGQTQAVFVRERAVDLVARELGLDPFELRARNALRPDELPAPLRSAPITLDNGDYPGALERAAAMARRWPEPPDDGRGRGTACVLYVQMAGVGPSAGNRAIGLDIGGYETTELRMEPDGTVRALVGVTPHGQGHETTFAQLVADRVGVAPELVRLVHSDTDVTPYSAYGTAASRSIAVGGGATVVAADRLAARLRAIAAELLEAAPADIRLEGGRATVAGTNVGVAIADVAARAWQGFDLPDGASAGLVERAVYDPEQFTFSYAVHVCRVAVDRETGGVDVEHYGVVHDCGTVVNPTIVEGQVHGGIAQGLGAALLEEVQFDAAGEPRSTSLLDYLVPDARAIPCIEIEHMEHPSPYTPGGMKGMGEGGTNGAYACVANAVADALPGGADVLGATPLTPERVWRALQVRVTSR